MDGVEGIVSGSGSYNSLTPSYMYKPLDLSSNGINSRPLLLMLNLVTCILDILFIIILFIIISGW